MLVIKLAIVGSCSSGNIYYSYLCDFLYSFEEWFNGVCGKMGADSVIVLDNAPYHSVQVSFFLAQLISFQLKLSLCDDLLFGVCLSTMAAQICIHCIIVCL